MTIMKPMASRTLSHRGMRRDGCAGNGDGPYAEIDNIKPVLVKSNLYVKPAKYFNGEYGGMWASQFYAALRLVDHLCMYSLHRNFSNHAITEFHLVLFGLRFVTERLTIIIT